MSVKDRIRTAKEKMKQSTNFNELAERSFIYSATEVGIVHPDTGSSLRFRDNGNVEMFADSYSGMVLSSEGKSANIYANYANVFSKKTHIQTDDNGFMWNYHVFNPDMSKIKLLICDENIIRALSLVMNGGISITGGCAVGPVTGQTLPTTGGTPQTIQPYIYDAKPELITKEIDKITNTIKKVI